MTENSVPFDRPSWNIENLVLCGRYIPGEMWSTPGNGVLWLEVVSEHEGAASVEDVQALIFYGLEHLKEWLRQAGIDDFSTHTDADGRAQLTASAFGFAGVIQQLSDFPFDWNLAPELALYVRIQRLARVMVTRREFLPFAAPAEISLPEIFKACLRAAEADEDGWSHWSGHTEEYVGRWVPAWTSERSRALRLVYASRADEQWVSGWKDSFAWAKRDHGQILLDAWVGLCTDYFVRPLLVKPEANFSAGASNTAYRVSYRGEDEVVERWQAALWGEIEEPFFAADGWLVWRILRQSFQPSGWRREWLNDHSGRAHYHLEFELVPPMARSEVDWRLEYYIVHNLFGIRAPLKDWWTQSRREWEIGNEVLIAPDEWILQDLWKAGAECGPIQASLETRAPAGCVIPPEAVLDLITTQLPKLTTLGFTVHTPELNAEQAADVKIRVQVQRVKSKVASSAWVNRSQSWFDAQQLVDFDWTVVVGDTLITREEFEEMVEKRTPVIQLEGSWRLIPLESILNQVRALMGSSDQKSVDLLQFSRSVLMSEAAADDEVSVDLDFLHEAEQARGMLDLLSGAEAPELMATPAGFLGTLRHYQSVGYSWLIQLRKFDCGGCLADDMGLGKTIQVLAYLQYVKEQNLNRAPHLLVCPTSLLQNWRAEIARFTPELRVYVHHGATRNVTQPNGQSPLKEAFEEYDLVMTTYATVMRDLEEFTDRTWDVLVLDEAQNIKNAQTKQAQAVRKLVASHRIALTGTPVENRLEELWSIFQFTNPGYLGTVAWFRKEFAEPVANHPQSLAARKLQRLLRPVLLRRHKTDPAIQVELPEKWEVREYSSLTTEQAALYQSFVNRLFVGVSNRGLSMSRRGQILAALVRLKQVCDHPCLVTGGSTDVARSGKLNLLLDLLEDVVSEGDAALVFTQFRDMGELLCGAMEGRFGWRPRFLHGGQTAQMRGEIVEAFQTSKDSAPVLVLSLKAGGVGLNLTRANHVFHFDRWWNPAVEDQATDRAFRIGQTKDVQVHKLGCLGTLEERIDTLIESKRQLSATVVGDSEAWLTELDDEELRGLFALNEETAVEPERTF